MRDRSPFKACVIRGRICLRLASPMGGAGVGWAGRGPRAVFESEVVAAEGESASSALHCQVPVVVLRSCGAGRAPPSGVVPPTSLSRCASPPLQVLLALVRGARSRTRCDSQGLVPRFLGAAE